MAAPWDDCPMGTAWVNTLPYDIHRKTLDKLMIGHDPTDTVPNLKLKTEVIIHRAHEAAKTGKEVDLKAISCTAMFRTNLMRILACFKVWTGNVDGLFPQLRKHHVKAMPVVVQNGICYHDIKYKPVEQFENMIGFVKIR